MTGCPVLVLRLGDVLRLRRPHPCGASEWQVDRLGADIGLRCLGCRRRVLLERRLVERRLVAFVSRGAGDADGGPVDDCSAPDGSAPDGGATPGDGATSDGEARDRGTP